MKSQQRSRRIEGVNDPTVDVGSGWVHCQPFPGLEVVEPGRMRLVHALAITALCALPVKQEMAAIGRDVDTMSCQVQVGDLVNQRGGVGLVAEQVVDRAVRWMRFSIRMSPPVWCGASGCL